MAQGCAIAGFGVLPLHSIRSSIPGRTSWCEAAAVVVARLVRWRGLAMAWRRQGAPGRGRRHGCKKKGARRADKWTGRLVHSTLLWKTNGAERARSAVDGCCTPAHLRLPLCTRTFLYPPAPSSPAPSHLPRCPRPRPPLAGVAQMQQVPEAGAGIQEQTCPIGAHPWPDGSLRRHGSSRRNMARLLLTWPFCPTALPPYRPVALSIWHSHARNRRAGKLKAREKMHRARPAPHVCNGAGMKRFPTPSHRFGLIHPQKPAAPGSTNRNAPLARAEIKPPRARDFFGRFHIDLV